MSSHPFWALPLHNSSANLCSEMTVSRQLSNSFIESMRSLLARSPIAIHIYTHVQVQNISKLSITSPYYYYIVACYVYPFSAWIYAICRFFKVCLSERSIHIIIIIYLEWRGSDDRVKTLNKLCSDWSSVTCSSGGDGNNNDMHSYNTHNNMV